MMYYGVKRLTRSQSRDLQIHLPVDENNMTQWNTGIATSILRHE